MKHKKQSGQKKQGGQKTQKKQVLMAASVASMIDQFNMHNIGLLQEMGFEVHVACNFRQGNTCSRKRIQKLLHELRDRKAVCHQWDCPRSIHDPAGCCRAYRQILRLMERHSFAWMHCHSPIGGALARLAAYRQGIPVMYTAHGFHFYRGAPLKNWLLYYPAEKLLARRTDMLVTVNREDYRFAGKNLKAGKVCYIPGVGVDAERFYVRKKSETVSGRFRKKQAWFCEKYQIPPDAFVLLSVGELNEGKNHSVAIRALAALGRKDVYYLVCGQGMLRDSLQRLADGLGIGGQVRLPGYQEAMPQIYRNADIFVFPSIREGMPVSLMEAMAASLPCVVSDIRGNRELIAPALRFDLKKPWQLTAALERLLNEGQLRTECGEHNRKRIQKYGQAAVEKRMRRIYSEMCGNAAVRKQISAAHFSRKNK